MKSPIITRKKYDKYTETKRNEISNLNWKIRELEEKLEVASRATKEILPRLVRLREPVMDREFNTYRVCADFHRDMVERCFTHGGDEAMIEYFADELSHQIKAKMIQFNFARCNRP